MGQQTIQWIMFQDICVYITSAGNLLFDDRVAFVPQQNWVGCDLRHKAYESLQRSGFAWARLRESLLLKDELGQHMNDCL